MWGFVGPATFFPMGSVVDSDKRVHSYVMLYRVVYFELKMNRLLLLLLLLLGIVIAVVFCICMCCLGKSINFAGQRSTDEHVE